MKITIAVTGASGAIYAHRLLCALTQSDEVSKIYLIFTGSGSKVWEWELPDVNPLESYGSKVEILDNRTFFCDIASGSNSADAMVVVPCSVGSASRIAMGVSSTLLERAADVQLKEQKQLIVVVRESPLSLIHLRNLTALSEAGAIILPASPSFYSSPKTLEDAVDTIVERILDKVGLKNNNFFRWKQN